MLFAKNDIHRLQNLLFFPVLYKCFWLLITEVLKCYCCEVTTNQFYKTAKESFPLGEDWESLQPGR
jgi:hypothetical protein